MDNPKLDNTAITIHFGRRTQSALERIARERRGEAGAEHLLVRQAVREFLARHGRPGDLDADE
jgi:hypothetical protein